MRLISDLINLFKNLSTEDGCCGEKSTIVPQSRSSVKFIIDLNVLLAYN